MKNSARFIFFILTVTAPGFAQEGHSPTLPFGTKEYKVTRYPTVSPVPPAHQYYNANPYYNYNNYYYGPNGVYTNGYYAPQQRQAPAPSSQYKSSNHDRLPKFHLQDDQLPSYTNSSNYPSLPGY